MYTTDQINRFDRETIKTEIKNINDLELLSLHVSGLTERETLVMKVYYFTLKLREYELDKAYEDDHTCKMIANTHLTH